jgi:hypothetical protein
MARLKWGCDNLRQILKKRTQAWEWADLCLTILYKMNIVWNEKCELFNGKWMMWMSRLTCIEITKKTKFSWQHCFSPTLHNGAIQAMDLSTPSESGHCTRAHLLRCFWPRRKRAVRLPYVSPLRSQICTILLLYIFCAVNVPGFTLIRESGHG